MGLTFVRAHYTVTLIQDVGYRKNSISCSYCRPAVGSFQRSRRNVIVKPNIAATCPH